MSDHPLGVESRMRWSSPLPRVEDENQHWMVLHPARFELLSQPLSSMLVHQFEV
jgi:hypothetical protein